ncbi:uncharacterized protein LOC111699924 [Eurytemora carolleeae]|uniref:uncharacterized protein LOC111699924 n=1 Tax=Eurytemora carolleeae TaxID=1294199 RepID=UPI000C77B1C4|nr:uncharacterized protein LOC111699924 [Eurytemora carolleeae]|eukprot:XP_023326475.1 uncharacterized protein LOC111699924 [Eurytemora affinis]
MIHTKSNRIEYFQRIMDENIKNIEDITKTKKSVEDKVEKLEKKIKLPQEKKKKIKSVNHVLQPLDPLPLLEYDQPHLREELVKLLGITCIKKKSLNSKIELSKQLSRAERRRLLRENRDFRRTILSKEPGMRINLRKYLLIGLNSVQQALQEDRLQFCFLDPVSPKNLIINLLPQMRSRGIPVLGIQQLKDLTKTHIGFKAMIVGVSSNKEEDLMPLVNAVLTAVDDTKRIAKPEPITEEAPENKNKIDQSELSEEMNISTRDPMLVQNIIS